MTTSEGSAYMSTDGQIHCGDCDQVALKEMRDTETVFTCSEHGWVATLADVPSE